MSNKQSVIIDFSDYSEDDLGPTVDPIIEELTDNAVVYPDLPVDVATLTVQKGSYTTILGKAAYAGKAADLGGARLTLEGSLRDNGVYINTVAKHDPIKLAQSGYPLTKAAAPIGVLNKTV